MEQNSNANAKKTKRSGKNFNKSCKPLSKLKRRRAAVAAAFKAAMDAVYRDLVDDNEDYLNTSASKLSNFKPPTAETCTPSKKEIPYVCEYCRDSSFKDQDECFKHVATCVFNPREDPFVQYGLGKNSETLPRKRRKLDS